MPVYQTIIIQQNDSGTHILDDVRTVVAKDAPTARIHALRQNPPPDEVPSDEVRVLVQEFGGS